MYVNNVGIVRDQSGIKDVNQSLIEACTVMDPCACTHFLGIKVERRLSGIFLLQRPFVKKRISPAHVKDAKKGEPPVPLTHPLYDPFDKRSDAERLGMAKISNGDILDTLLFPSTRTSPDQTSAASMHRKF